MSGDGLTVDRQQMRWVDRFRPRRWSELIPTADVSRLEAVKEAVANDRFGLRWLLFGPWSSGKSALLRLIGARRCCGQAELGNADPCGACRWCEACFSGRWLPGTAYIEINVGRRDLWQTDLHDAVELGAGPVKVVHGNPGWLPLVIGIDEFQEASRAQQHEVGEHLDNRTCGFVIACSDLNRLSGHLIQRCRCIEMRLPDRPAFCQWFSACLSRAGVEHDAGVPDLFFNASHSVPRTALHLAEEYAASESGSWSSDRLRKWLQIDPRHHLGGC